MEATLAAPAAAAERRGLGVVKANVAGVTVTVEASTVPCRGVASTEPVETRFRDHSKSSSLDRFLDDLTLRPMEEPEPRRLRFFSGAVVTEARAVGGFDDDGGAIVVL